jgi:hypothetical protein
MDGWMDGWVGGSKICSTDCNIIKEEWVPNFLYFTEKFSELTFFVDRIEPR